MKFIKQNQKKFILVTLLLITALSSMFGISKTASNPETYKSTIQSIDEKKSIVMGVTAGAAATSTALALVPGDSTTPIANQILQLSSYLLIVVCVLVLEKSLLTVAGLLSFKILVPIICVLFGIYIFYRNERLKILALKLLAFAAVIVMIVPCSLKIGDMICDINSTVIEEVSEVAEIANEEKLQTDTENDSFWENTVGGFTSAISKAKSFAKEQLNRFTDAIAVFIIAYCAIPIIILFVMIWFVNFLFGIKIPLPKPKKSKKSNKENEMSEE